MKRRREQSLMAGLEPVAMTDDRERDDHPHTSLDLGAIWWCKRGRATFDHALLSLDTGHHTVLQTLAS
jgi:hypothetical protein